MPFGLPARPIYRPAALLIATVLIATVLLSSVFLTGCNAATPVGETDTGQASGEMAGGGDVSAGEHAGDTAMDPTGDLGPSMGTVSAEAGLYRVSYEATLEPLVANELHTWNLTVTDADGQPVEGATIVVTGGMPGHSHGLPTEPQVVAGDGPGEYSVEGMRFQMSGPWTVTFEVDAAPGTDTVRVPLEVGNPQS